MTKLGPHLQPPVSSRGAEWARNAPIVKEINGRAGLVIARQDAFRIFRWWWPVADQTLQRNPAEAAAKVIHELGGYNHPRLYIEAYNECHQDLGQGLEAYIEWTKAFCDYAHLHGYKVAAFGFSTGNPTDGPAAWRYLRSNRYGGADALSVHQYFSKNGFTIWNGLRHRLIHEWTNGDHPPIFITECGIDDV